MKYFISTDSIKKIDGLELLSITIISEDNREYTAISGEINFTMNPTTKENEIIQKNMTIFELALNEEDREFLKERFKVLFLKKEQYYFLQFGKSLLQIKKEIKEFIGNDIPEFYSHSPEIDWINILILFNWKCPNNWPINCINLHTYQEYLADTYLIKNDDLLNHINYVNILNGNDLNISQSNARKSKEIYDWLSNLKFLEKDNLTLYPSNLVQDKESLEEYNKVLSFIKQNLIVEENKKFNFEQLGLLKQITYKNTNKIARTGCARGTGISMILSAYIAYYASHNNDKIIVIYTPSVQQSLDIIYKIDNLVRRSTSDFIKSKNGKDIIIKLNGKESIIKIISNLNDIRGMKFDLLICDNIFGLDKEKQLELNRFFIQYIDEAKLIICSTGS